MQPGDLLSLDAKEILEPETVTHTFPSLESIERQQLYVHKALTVSRSIYEDMDVFENAVLVLNGISPNIDSMEGASPLHIWKAILDMQKIMPDMEFSHEVLMYIKMIYSEEGYLFYPDTIGLKNDMLPKIMKRAEKGPFPLKEDVIGIQAAKLLKIQTYIGENNAG